MRILYSIQQIGFGIYMLYAIESHNDRIMRGITKSADSTLQPLLPTAPPSALYRYTVDI